LFPCSWVWDPESIRLRYWSLGIREIAARICRGRLGLGVKDSRGQLDAKRKLP
jgi:hypothetical protein